VVICGSANLNDRSQLGDHDSEIAVIIEDRTPLQSTMNGQQWLASKFAATLRRQLFRRHLGLLRPQNYEQPDGNFLPVTAGPNEYDFNSEEDQLVTDPLSQDLENLWNGTAHTNTEVFNKVFHPVPADNVRTWKDYDEYYEKYFRLADKDKPAGPYGVGHVVAENFPGGVSEVKELLSQVRGTLFEMPLLFLKNEDMAVEGMSLNALTEVLYT
jgi:phospholipase D1/2